MADDTSRLESVVKAIGVAKKKAHDAGLSASDPHALAHMHLAVWDILSNPEKAQEEPQPEPEPIPDETYDVDEGHGRHKKKKG